MTKVKSKSEKAAAVWGGTVLLLAIIGFALWVGFTTGLDEGWAPSGIIAIVMISGSGLVYMSKKYRLAIFGIIQLIIGIPSCYLVAQLWWIGKGTFPNIDDDFAKLAFIAAFIAPVFLCATGWENVFKGISEEK